MRLRLFEKKQINFAWPVLFHTPPPFRPTSLSQFQPLSLSNSEYIKPAPAERILGKPEFENFYVNMSKTYCTLMSSINRFRPIRNKQNSLTILL